MPKVPGVADEGRHGRAPRAVPPRTHARARAPVRRWVRAQPTTAFLVGADAFSRVEGAYLAMQLSLTVVLLAVAVTLVHLTRGRLGLRAAARPGGHP